MGYLMLPKSEIISFIEGGLYMDDSVYNENKKF